MIAAPLAPSSEMHSIGAAAHPLILEMDNEEEEEEVIAGGSTRNAHLKRGQSQTVFPKNNSTIQKVNTLDTSNLSAGSSHYTGKKPTAQQSKDMMKRLSAITVVNRCDSEVESMP